MKMEEDSTIINGITKDSEGGICSGEWNTLPCKLILILITQSANLSFKKNTAGLQVN